MAHMKLLISKMKRDRFGASAERGRKLLDQLEMQPEELETAAVEDKVAADAASDMGPMGHTVTDDRADVASGVEVCDATVCLPTGDPEADPYVETLNRSLRKIIKTRGTFPAMTRR
jgi:hypothetical protein